MHGDTLSIQTASDAWNDRPGLAVPGGRYLVTGFTGSLGREVVRALLAAPNTSVLGVSRDEEKQWRMQRVLSSPHFSAALGDVRDPNRIQFLMKSCDYVIHCAALKQVDTAGSNGFEYVRTNIDGTNNVLQAARKRAKGVIFVSTDKAANPASLYGATKLIGESLVTETAESARSGSVFASVRLGNLLGSRGSILPLFRSLAASGRPLTITDPAMTRFVLTPAHAARIILRALDVAKPGEVMVPRLPSFAVSEFAEAVAPGHPIEVIGLRAGERLYEELLTPLEQTRIETRGEFVCVQPTYALKRHRQADALTAASFRSDQNPVFLDTNGIRALIANVELGEADGR